MNHLILLPLIFAVHAQDPQAAPAPIQCHISGLGNDTVFVFYSILDDEPDMHRDTTYAFQDRFSYRPKENKPMEIGFVAKHSMVVFPSGRIYVPQTSLLDLIVQPDDKITLEGSLSAGYLDYRVTGSRLNAELATGRSVYKQSAIDAVSFELERSSLPHPKTEDSLLFAQRVAAQGKIVRIKLDYIAQHPDNDLSAFYLLTMAPETFLQCYPSLSDAVRNGLFKKRLTSQYRQCQQAVAANTAAGKLAVGSKAPDFTLKASDGRTFSLSAGNSLYTVLDFWGSWCGWCIQELPHIKQYRNKYGSQIRWVGIACQDHEAPWRNVLRKYQLDWTQLLNTGGEDVATMYGVTTFPTKIIIDQNMKIVGIFRDASEDFFKKLDTLGLSPQ